MTLWMVAGETLMGSRRARVREPTGRRLRRIARRSRAAWARIGTRLRWTRPGRGPETLIVEAGIGVDVEMEVGWTDKNVALASKNFPRTA
jgi:hypothetical protein